MSRPEVSPPAVSSKPAKPHAAGGCLARIVWMIVGNLVLALALMRIAERREGFWRPADAVYWAVAVLLVLVRYVDVRFLEGETATGNRATMSHWRRYVLILAIVTLIGWGVAHAAAWVR